MASANRFVEVDAPPTTPQRFVEAKPPLTTAQKMVRGSAGSIVGGAIGAGLGTAIVPGAGTLVGGMVGSGLGEAATQYGVVDKVFRTGSDAGSLLQVGAATALAGVSLGFSVRDHQLLILGSRRSRT